jgi:hypothetical protein
MTAGETYLHFMRVSPDGLQEEHKALASEVPHDLELRESYGFSDGVEEATYMVWAIELRRLAGCDVLEKHITLVPQFSREIH